MYTIYHIPGVKVGCTARDPKVRVKEQGHTRFEVLAETDDIETANELERLWQRRLGYRQDKRLYAGMTLMQEIANSLESKAKMLETRKTSEIWKQSRGKGLSVMMARVKKPVLQFTKAGDFIQEWPSASDAGRALGCTPQTINMCLQGKTKTAKRFVWRYKLPE